MITIVNYGMGNLGSVQNMLKRIDVRSQITADPDVINKAEKILLPGVGAFDAAISRIDELGLREVLVNKATKDKTPFLGICLGMQLLTRGSEEGVLKGLNLVPADTKRFPVRSGLKVPHMGWNFVKQVTPSQLTEGFDDSFRFYFVHSYRVICDSESNCILKTSYGDDFHSAIQNDNVFGTQFHPEKSHKFGFKVLSNFSKI